jgi:hypothetical protein
MWKFFMPFHYSRGTMAQELRYNTSREKELRFGFPAIILISVIFTAVKLGDSY